MPLSQAFSCLGIPISKNVPAIKKAYQIQLSLHHPEEDPEGFMHLHEAYRTALDYAQDKADRRQTSAQTFSWQPDTDTSAGEESGYDSLFSNLDETTTADLPQQKKSFFKQLQRLKWHWLPIPRKCWCRFFSSDAFLLCRGEEDCLAKLFELMVGKIHSYGVLRFLLSQLWELYSWQQSENLGALANKTHKCIEELKEQYKHYLKLNTSAWIHRQIIPIWWYYQALPFYFKLLVSTFLMPLAACGSGEVLVMILFGFYILEFCIWFMKIYRKLGIYHPTIRYKKGVMTVKSRGDSGWFIAISIYSILGHLCGCMFFMEALFS